jgi:hypothetical protein
MSDPGKRQTKIADHVFSSGVGIDFGGAVECVGAAAVCNVMRPSQCSRERDKPGPARAPLMNVFFIAYS